VLHHEVSGPQSEGADDAYKVTSIRRGSRTRETVADINKPEASSWFGKASYQHMTSATDEFYIMLEAPCYYPNKTTPIGTVDWTDWGWNFLESTHVRLVDRNTGKSTTYPVSHNTFAIHHINAFKDESTNSIVLDVIQSFPSFLPCSTAFKSLTLNNSINNWQSNAKGLMYSTPLRLTMPLDSPGSKVTPVLIGSGKGMEFPTIRYDELNGKPYQWAYGTYLQGKASAYYDALVKLNVNSGNQTVWGIPGHYVGEPIFVADPAGTEEDDGVVMTNVLDSINNKTYLVVLDAVTMKEVARTSSTPRVMPLGYHGIYYNRKMN